MGCLKNKNSFFHGPRGQKSKIKVLARPYFLLRLEGRILPCLFLELGGCQQYTRYSLVIDASLQSLAPLSHGILLVFLCVTECLFIRIPPLDLGLTLIRYDFILPDYFYKEIFSKQGHIYRYLGLGFQCIFFGGNNSTQIGNLVIKYQKSENLLFFKEFTLNGVHKQ